MSRFSSNFLIIILIFICIIFICGSIYLYESHILDNDSNESIIFLQNGNETFTFHDRSSINENNINEDDVGTCWIMEDGQLKEIKCTESVGKGSASGP